ncbi:MAG: hypothetical protein KF729_15120 [Sandaracinaceae bacterium]|nr:hypothetical protein [Sandaracinaceae bacterium]
MSEDERSYKPPYPPASGPPTIEEQISPFHPRAPRTIQGMPAARFPEPRVKEWTGEPGAAAPQVIHVPSSAVAPAPSPDGPTVPDGLPSLMGGPSVSAEIGLDELATDPYAGRKLVGEVPPPDAPKIQISKSMEYDVSALADLRPPERTTTARAPRHVAPPTEVMLPALGRKKKEPKERSDAWLVIGLGLLLLVIVALVVAVVVGVLTRVG